MPVSIQDSSVPLYEFQALGVGGGTEFLHSTLCSPFSRSGRGLVALVNSDFPSPHLLGFVESVELKLDHKRKPPGVSQRDPVNCFLQNWHSKDRLICI